jgi:ABC-type glycerol-3-phosphate transport system substrate-binding protein
MSDCATIKSKLSLPCFAMPMSPSNQLQRLWYALSGSTQSDLFFDYKTGSFDLSEPGIQEAFTQIQTMYNDGYIVPGLNTLAASRSQMIAGQAVMYTDGAWIPGQVFGPAGFNNYGVAATPAPDAGRTGALSQLPTQNVYWVNSKIATTHAEAAWKFIQYITQPDGIFVQTYLKDNFGTLAYANNAKYLGSNPQLATVLSLGETKGFRVANPVPLQQCPDLAQSQAFAKATNAISTTAEWDAIATALTSKSSLMAAATNIVNTRNNILTTTLATEAGGATPLKVSINCYKFPTWNYTQDFDQKYSPPK